jgi:hypothetical protein
MNLHEIPFEYIILFIALSLIFIVFRNVYERSNKSNNRNIVVDKNSYFLNKNMKLRNEYINLHGGSRIEAAEILDRQIDVLMRKHPNKDMTWYIEKAIHDLKRDRRIS